MKAYYRRNKEDMAELKDILYNCKELSIFQNDYRMLVVKTGNEEKHYSGYKVTIDGIETFFTSKLLDFLKEKEIISRV